MTGTRVLKGHRVFQVNGGVVRRGTAPAGMHMDLGARDINGQDADHPIRAINWAAGAFKREDGDWQAFPEWWYRTADIKWDEP